MSGRLLKRAHPLRSASSLVRPWAQGLLAAVPLVLCLGAARPVAAGPGEPVPRLYDPVVMTGESFPDLLDLPLERFVLYALGEDGASPIPFQIDEVSPSGRIVLTSGRDKGKDADDGRFDANDQLVFMAADVGRRASRRADLPEAAVQGAEIEIVDPLGGPTRYAYLLVFAGPAKRSPVDYVRYEPEGRGLVSYTYIAKVGESHPATAATYAFRAPVGGDETDIMDRVKLRLSFTFFLRFVKNEEDVAVKEIGYVDGPVRVILRTAQSLKLLFGIPGPSTTGDTYFYPAYGDFPFIVDFPVKPREFRAVVYDDFSNAIGWTFFSGNNPAGHTIDGISDEGDKQVDRGRLRWSVVSGKRNAFWSVIIFPPDCPVYANLYFRDDRTVHDLPEDVKGLLPGVGWDLSEGWDQVKKYPVVIRFLHFFTTAYRPGDERSVLAVHDHPLETGVGPLPAAVR